MTLRENTRKVKVGDRTIGGGSPVAVQSMLSIPSTDIAGSVAQAKALEAAGCEIIRIAVPDMAAVRLIDAIKKEITVPLVADIHFDYRLALESAAAGIDKIRINPGNIGEDGRVRQVADACRQKEIPIRIGVNSGSVEKEFLARYGGPTPEALVESALYHVSLLNKYGFDDICISLKSSSVPTTMRAYQLMHEKTNYPLHLGVTEAGTEYMGTIKSAAGIGGLLALGIGDTIRVSLTADPVHEITAAYAILKAVGLNDTGVNIVSCPTCGRTKINLIEIANEVEQRVAGLDAKLKVAVMGCAVNGPGEAREADIGIAGGDGEGLIFRKGEILRKVPQDQLVDELMKEIHAMIKESR